MPFLSLYKIMPTEGEIEKFIRLQRGTGFPGTNMHQASTGKSLDCYYEKRAEMNPGRLVTPQELNSMAGYSPTRGVNNQEETTFEDETETERTDLPNYPENPPSANFNPAPPDMQNEETKEEAKVQQIDTTGAASQANGPTESQVKTEEQKA